METELTLSEVMLVGVVDGVGKTSPRGKVHAWWEDWQGGKFSTLCRSVLHRPSKTLHGGAGQRCSKPACAKYFRVLDKTDIVPLEAPQMFCRPSE